MITCAECQKQEIEGTLFCSHCGAPMLPEGVTDTQVLPFSDTSIPRRPPLVGKEVGEDRAASKIRFVIPSSGRQVTLLLKDPVRIGRHDPVKGRLPELDLTQDGGVECGISRLHAVVRSTGQGIAISDLKSINGTYVNDYRLPPELPFALNSGDELKLGTLLIHVFLED